MSKSKANKTRKIFVTEGRRLLKEVEEVDQAIADKMELGKAIVGHWRNGRRLPSEINRHKLELLYGIPPRSWDVSPGTDLTDGEIPPTNTRIVNSINARTRGDDNDALVMAMEQIDEIKIDLGNVNLTDAAKAKLRDTLTKLIALKVRIERDRDLLEDRVVREHPEWLKLKSRILEALKPHPEVAKAVAESIK
ncbi:MAG: hypothetical protein GY700_13575 [Propionibacteriaceae bacterium]|nr:hypothetical protein [Propionibacteriaceae bacterium]